MGTKVHAAWGWMLKMSAPELFLRISTAHARRSLAGICGLWVWGKACRGGGAEGESKGISSAFIHKV